MSAPTNKPPLTVLLGPAGSGKSQRCLDRLIAAPAVLVVVPSASHAAALCARARVPIGSPAGKRVLPFNELVERLCGPECARPLGAAARRAILANIVAARLDPHSYFGRVRQSAGFAAALDELIRELKLSCLSPASLLGAIGAATERLDDPQFRDKAGELANIFAGYNEFLRANALCDDEDLLARAIHSLQNGAELPGGARELWVDGFVRLPSARRELLAAAAEHEATVVVTLTGEEERPLLFATTLRLLASLQDRFTVAVQRLDRCQDTASPLHHLERCLFAPAPAVADGQADVEAPLLQVFDAPNPYTEVEMVVRELWREHERGTPWGRCAIVARNPVDYGPLLEAACERFDVPFSSSQPVSLAETPAVKPLLALLRALTNGWRRDDLFEFLRSSYSGVDKLEVERLRRRAQRAAVRDGRDAWARLMDEEPEEGTVKPAMIALLRDATRMIGGTRAPQQHAGAIKTLLAILRYSERVESDATARAGGAAPEVPPRTALSVAIGVMEELARVIGISRGEPIPFEQFFASLAAAWAGTIYSSPAKPDTVILIEPYDVRQRDCAFTAVMGLTEGAFPRRTLEDPFLRDDERAALRSAELDGLEPRLDRADDERLLFYLAATSARERLLLSHARASDTSDALPSFYLDEISALFDRIKSTPRTLADVAPRPDECVDHRDRVLNACAVAADALAGPDTLFPSITELIASVPPAGRPPLPRLGEEARANYAASRCYSVSELESFLRCPFAHFVNYGLNVHPDLRGGADEQGTLYHRVLRHAFRRKKALADGSVSIADLLTEELDAEMTSARIDAGPHRRKLMLRFLREALALVAEREGVYGPKFGFQPEMFEVAFGAEALTEEGVERDYDPASKSQPLTVQPDDGDPAIRLCGAIDRVDVTADGGRALVMDYKTGKSTDYAQMQNGSSLQMPVYMMALEQLWGKQAVAACYDSPRDSGRRRIFRTDGATVQQFGLVTGQEGGDMVKPLSAAEAGALLQTARESIVRAVRGIEGADILPRPGDHCAFCSYADCCRTDRANAHDGEPHDIMAD